MFGLVFIFLFLSNPTFAIEVNCEIGVNRSIISWTERELERLSLALPANIKILEVEYRSEWIFIYGIVDGKKIKLADVDIVVRGDVIEFHRDVIPAARGYGLGDFMVKAALEQNPQITKIHHYLIDTNRNIFSEKLLKEIGLHPGRSLPENYKDYSDYFFREAKDKFLNLPPGEQQEFIIKAIKETPAYKSSSKVGLASICSPGALFRVKDRLEIEFYTCKQ